MFGARQEVLRNSTLTVMAFCLLLAVSTGWAVAACAQGKKAGEIIHDAEYYVLEAQHGERWARQDQDLQAKLKALREKHGAPPNIIHIMWDDTPVGEVGIPHLQKNRGFVTPNMNKFDAEGIYFTRMYTESCGSHDRSARGTQRDVQRRLPL